MYSHTNCYICAAGIISGHHYRNNASVCKRSFNPVTYVHSITLEIISNIMYPALWTIVSVRYFRVIRIPEVGILSYNAWSGWLVF